jgi:hypothetical protein
MALAGVQNLSLDYLAQHPTLHAVPAMPAAQDHMALAGAQNLSLDYPAQHPAWLPTSLTALRLECPTLGTLPDCLSTLSGLASLEISTRSLLANPDLILQHMGGCSLYKFLF